MNTIIVIAAILLALAIACYGVQRLSFVSQRSREVAIALLAFIAAGLILHVVGVLR